MRTELRIASAIVAAGMIGMGSAQAADLEFQLLDWNSTQATDTLPSAEGRKPAASMPATGDWLIFTGDDINPGSTYNPQGSLSHNLAQLGGTGGSAFNMAPSLSGSLTLQLNPAGEQPWNVAVSALSYSGVAMPTMFMNQSLVTPGSLATQNPAFNINGLGNAGTWQAGSAGNWAIQYNLDFYFATNADGDPSPADIDATFNDKSQVGYLLPTSLLTPSGLADLSFAGNYGFYSGDFATYLLEQIAPRLPADATYLLVTQMGMTNPDYAEAGLPITTASAIGNMTFAYTTNQVPEPATALILAGLGAMVMSRRPRRRMA